MVREAHPLSPSRMRKGEKILGQATRGSLSRNRANPELSDVIPSGYILGWAGVSTRAMGRLRPLERTDRFSADYRRRLPVEAVVKRSEVGLGGSLCGIKWD